MKHALRNAPPLLRWPVAGCTFALTVYILNRWVFRESHPLIQTLTATVLWVPLMMFLVGWRQRPGLRSRR